MTAIEKPRSRFMHATRRVVAFGALLAVLGGIAVVGIGTHDRLGPADLGVVLGTLANTNNTPTPRLQARCDRGYDVWRAGYVPVLMVSGGRDWHGLNEAPVMRDYLLRRGVPAAAIVIDTAGVDSWHTALHAHAWLVAHHARRVMIVTQGFHVPRCRLAFAHFDDVDVLWTHARFWEWRDLLSIARELPALLKYAWLRRP